MQSAEEETIRLGSYRTDFQRKAAQWTVHCRSAAQWTFRRRSAVQWTFRRRSAAQWTFHRRSAVQWTFRRRFLATGNSYASQHSQFLIGRSTIGGIVRETCDVLWQCLVPLVMAPPSRQDWLDVAEGFMSAAQFPNCIGALDGKHIHVLKPPNLGSQYFNYQQFFSVVLLAVADSNYRFLLVDIGAFGSAGDARIFSTSRMGRRMREQQLSIPEPQALPGSSGTAAPFVFVADEAFGLSNYVMRPFARRNIDTRRQAFNYRLTRAQRYVECAFGILANRWRVLLSTIQLAPENVSAVIRACVVLHNFCRRHDTVLNVPHPLPTAFGGNVLEEAVQHGRPAQSAVLVRDLFMAYFLSPQGALPWQLEHARGSR
ncbi:uncharacterized protein [Eleutherodactylus coqui]|uniref:uncharacterized protein isoform X2 n=1 Tax=Eleutherodactylus coqui TaxID=57060 RepID=UPI0034620C56